MKGLYKLPNGKWRYRKRIDKKTYSFNFEYKPKESEILTKLELASHKIRNKKLALKDAMYAYIESKNNSISPSTEYGYYRIIKLLENDYADFLSLNIFDIDKYTMQKFINSYAAKHKPKSVKNVYSQVKASIELFREDFKCKVTIPKDIHEEPYIPTDEDIKILLTHTKGTKYDIPIKLALNGLRLSELLCIDVKKDVSPDGTIIINKAKVKGMAGEVIKTTKTAASTRTIKVSEELVAQILKQGYIYKGYRGGISDFLLDLHRLYNLPHYSIHKLRHYYCSLMISEGVPFQYVRLYGGWSSDSVMKRVYAHALKDRDYRDVGINYLKSLQPT